MLKLRPNSLERPAENRGTVTHMSEKVTPFPIPPGQRFSFLAGGRTYVFVIPPFVRRKPKPAEVIPISTTLSPAGAAAGATARLNLPSALPGVMNVLTTNRGRRSNMKTFIINSENKVTAGAEPEHNATGVARFSTIDELTQMTHAWRCVQVRP